MVFNGLVQAFQESLDGILLGGLSFALFGKIIADIISIKKIKKNIDLFGGSLGNNGKAMLKIVNDFVDKVEVIVNRQEINVNTLLNVVEQERKDKEFWQEVSVIALSTANIPIAQKKEYYNAVLNVSNISDVAKDSLLASIEADEQKVAVSNDEIDGALGLLQNKDDSKEKGV